MKKEKRSVYLTSVSTHFYWICRSVALFLFMLLLQESVNAQDRIFWGIPYNNISSSKFDGTDIRQTITISGQTYDMETDFYKNVLYWGEGNSIKKANTDGTNVQTLHTGTGSIGGLALDLTNNKLYFAKFGVSNVPIMRCNLDGTGLETIATSPISNGRTYTLSISTTLNKIYWTEQSGANNYVMRCNLDGSNIETLMTVSNFMPGLTIDEKNQKLYLAYYYDNKVMITDMTCSTPPTLVFDSSNGTFQMCVNNVDNKLFFAELSTRKIRKCNLDGSSPADIVSLSSGSIMALSIPTVPPAPTISANETYTFKLSDFLFSSVDKDLLTKIQMNSLVSKGIIYLDANNNNLVDAGEAIVINQEISKVDINAGKLKFNPTTNESGSPYTTFGFKWHNVSSYSVTDYLQYIYVLDVAPVVTTQAVSSIATTTATGNGNITSLGVPNPTSYGVCWNTTGSPTTSDNKVDNGTASLTGAFTASMTGLTSGTTYYVRAFASNTGGTSYGGEVTFTTSTVSLSGSTGGTTTGQNSPVYIASSANVTGTTLNGAIAFIGSNFNSTQDVLGIDGLQSGTSGSISYSYDSSKGVLTLTGDANVATYQSIIRKITYTNTSATPSTSSRSITISLNKALPFSTNGHYYEFISSPGISWTSAKTAAEGLTYFGLKGYLATITSAAENEFCTSKLSGDGWMGASDSDIEGTWKWVTGPEAGHSFSEYSYTNWNTGQPDNYNGVEDYGQFYTNGKWNDLPNSEPSIAGYVVEFGGSAGDPVLDVSDVVTVNVTNPVSVSSVTVPPNATYRGGNTLYFTVTYSAAVNVDVSGGIPYIPITLNTGGTVNAFYIRNSSTNKLLFGYQIVSGNLDSDGVSVGSAITANGGSLKNTGGDDVNLTLNSVGSTSGVLVDAVNPSVLSVSSTTANGTYKEGDVIAITISFSETVTVTGTPILVLNSGGTAYYTSGSGSSLLTFNYTVESGHSSADLDYISISSMNLSGGSIKDAVGNNTWLNLPTVGGVSSLGGQKDIVISKKPTIVTKEAASVLSTTATINGTVNANNSSSTVTFEYGLTNSYGLSVVATQSPVTGNTTTSVNGLLTGLIPNATYHYRVKAVNAIGTSYGADSVFTTIPSSSTTFTGTGNWSEMERWSAGIPGITTTTTINGNCTATDNYEVASLSISSGKLTINPDKTLKVTGSFVNNVGADAFILKSDATGTGKIVSNSTGVNATVQQYFVKNQWHYYTTPVSSSVNAYPLLYNLWAVNHDEKSNNWTFMNSGNSLISGKGYGARYSNSSGNDTLITIKGSLNAGNVIVEAKKEGDGWNLIGNPYPATADWTNGILRDNVYNAIYLWNPVTNNYGYFVDGISVNGQTKYIAPMQGFFVKATAGGSVTFTDATKSTSPSYFRNAETQTLIRLLLKSDKDLTDETVVRVKYDATNNFDAEYDANKLISNENGIPQILTYIASEEYAVNTVSQIDERTKIPVKIMLPGAGKYTLSISELKDFDSNLPVYIYDTRSKRLINLMNENFEYEVNNQEVLDTYIVFTNTLTSTLNNHANSITIFSKHRTIFVDGLLCKPYEIQIFTLDGVLISHKSVNTGKIEIPVKSEGIYSVKVIPAIGNVINSKVVVK